MRAVNPADLIPLFEELNESRPHSERANATVRATGAAGSCLRGLGLVRIRQWVGARLDAREALKQNGPDPKHADAIAYGAAVTLWASRDYEGALAAIGPVADGSGPLSNQASEQRFSWSKLLDLYGLEVPDALPEQKGVQTTERRRDLLRHVGSLMRHLDPATAAAEVDGLIESGRIEPFPELWAVRARLALRAGGLDGLRACMDRVRNAGGEVVEAETLLALHEERWADVLEWTRLHRESPPLLMARGLALLGLGAFQEASDRFWNVRKVRLNSFTAMLSEAYASYRRSPNAKDEGLERRFETLCERGPLWMGVAAQAEGVELWEDQGLNIRREEIAVVLKRAFEMQLHDGELSREAFRHPDGRVVPSAPTEDEKSVLEVLHAADRDVASQIEGQLIRGLGVRPPKPDHGGSRPARKSGGGGRFLTGEQLESFDRDGFLVLRGAFDASYADRWIEGAIERIRTAPEQYIKNFDPSRMRCGLERFDPEDSSTWGLSRIELDGDELFRISDFSSAGWQAICELLGGEDRVKTHTWNNYLVINVDEDADVEDTQPKRDAQSWHIDDPGPTTQLGRIRNGVVCFTLMSKLLPSSGNTWLAPDSYTRVIEELVDRPEGVDFCSNRGHHITMRCERFAEITGEPGDLVIMHPLMMHSSSPNPSGRVRWMGNPMVYLNDFHDPSRPLDELSPVERGMRRILDARGGAAH